MEQPLTLPSGRVVAILNLVVLRHGNEDGGTFDIQYRTSIHENDREAVLEEAREVVLLHRAFAEEHGYSMRAQVCTPQAGAGGRELPTRIITFARSDTGEWSHQRTVRADGTTET